MPPAAKSKSGFRGKRFVAKQLQKFSTADVEQSYSLHSLANKVGTCRCVCLINTETPNGANQKQTYYVTLFSAPTDAPTASSSRLIRNLLLKHWNITAIRKENTSSHIKSGKHIKWWGIGSSAENRSSSLQVGPLKPIISSRHVTHTYGNRRQPLDDKL